MHSLFPPHARGNIIEASSQSFVKVAASGESATSPLKPIRLSGDGYDDVFKEIPNRPTTLSLLHVEAEKVDALGRPGRRLAIVALSRKPAMITVSRKQGKSWRGTSPKKGNLAIAMILALGLRYKTGGSDDNRRLRRMVPELLGLSPSATIYMFRDFCQPPFLDFHDILNLVHAVARNIAHHDEGEGEDVASNEAVDDEKKSKNENDAESKANTDSNKNGDNTVVDKNEAEDHKGGAAQPILALRATAEIVADVLNTSVKEIDSDNTGKNTSAAGAPLAKDAEFFTDCLQRWDNDIDRGIQVGLVLAGVRKFYRRIKDKKEKRYDLSLWLVDMVLAGLTGVPIGGFVPAIVQSVSAKAGNDLKGRRLERVNDMFSAIMDAYYSKVEIPLHRDGGLAGVSGVDAVVFTRWVDLVLKYDTPAQI
ncbi:hypothetical protein N7489_004340 [Penicillium chrysogenum]|uniref:uncharacterized protein n=1 Tax=Penicillium chrysogenum TaxID=5076 RepID=UPI0024DF162A|nr:uncharacterized protein N7489_004340 [Penicillium chrysogenum]KAJ5244244.1 hypothetical protein N7489_004340 [Penicillium chrysogenum]